MGGYHITGRKVDNENYYALNSLFRVPDLVQANDSAKTYPEFIYNFQNNAHGYVGFDIGLGYGFDNQNSWCIFGNGSTALIKNIMNENRILVDSWYQSGKFNLQPGSTVMFAAVINQSNPILEATLKTAKGDTILASLNIPMQYNAWVKMKAGSSVVRETLLASNKPQSDYINCGAMFKFAKWYRGTLTRVSGSNPYEQFNGHVIAPGADEGYLDRTRMRTYCVPEYWDYQPTPFGCECASAGFIPNFKNMYYDFPHVDY